MTPRTLVRVKQMFVDQGFVTVARRGRP